MTDNSNSDPRYTEAKRRVEAQTAFYIHALIYVCVISGLAGINLISRGGWWVHWPAVGWGIGLAAHALLAFCGRSRRLDDWQARRIENELRRM